MSYSQPNRSNSGLPAAFKNIPISRATAFGIMIIGALLAFELFNYSTTDFALKDLLGDLKFMGFYWSTILAIAFCGIDFAGIARLFTPEKGRDEPAEVWYLFGAWVLAAAMNAILTWWGVSVAVGSHTSQGSTVLGTATTSKIVPIFVAVMVWVIRILIIGTFSIAGESLFGNEGGGGGTRRAASSQNTPTNRPRTNFAPQQSFSNAKPYQKTYPQPANNTNRPPTNQPTFNPNQNRPSQKQDPTYHNLAGPTPPADAPGKSLSFDASTNRGSDAIKKL